MSERALVEPILLPLWRPRFPCSGIATTAASLDDQAMEKAAASGVNGDIALVTAWAMLVSRYVGISPVAVGLLDDLSENVANAVPKELAVPASAGSLVADVYRCVHSKAVYADEAIQELAAQLSIVFTALLTALSAYAGKANVRVKDLPWVSAQQRGRLLELAAVSLTNKGRFPEAQDVSIQALFSQWAAKTPDQTALVHGKKTLTYGEMHHHVSALAYKLHSKYGVSRESRVAVFGQRSVDVSIAIMAVVYTGGAFVPIDSQFPSDRVAYILEDSQCTAVLTTSQDVIQLPMQCTPPVVLVDEVNEAMGKPAPSVANIQNHADGLAYIIYTSGTT
ncbi:hypothetical protein H4R34_005520, partial [Dimargaris verticillata]